MIVKKAYNMAGMMHIPVLGLVENFSYLKCPDCGKEIKLFGESHIDETAAELGVKVLGKLPMDHKLAALCDKPFLLYCMELIILLQYSPWHTGARQEVLRRRQLRAKCCVTNKQTYNRIEYLHEGGR